MKDKLERAVDALLDLLDGLDDPDLEDGADLEPDADGEPSLGAREIHPSIYSERAGDQTSWAFSGNDQDLEDEHDGREPSEDDELSGDENDCSLGATTALNQAHAWASGANGLYLGGEPEPSLGWSNTAGHGHPEMALRGYDDDREAEHDGREPEDHIADHDGLSIELSEGGSPTPGLDQRVEIGGAAHELAREQAAMSAATARLTAIVAGVRARSQAAL
jgi:hypothetical protein